MTPSAADARQAGYTLLEMAAVLGIAAAMALAATPALVDRAAQQRVDLTVEGLRTLVSAAVSYRTDGGQITEPDHGHYGTWPERAADLLGADTSTPPDGVPDEAIYLGHFRNDGAALATRDLLNAMGLPIEFGFAAGDADREGVLRIQTSFRAQEHARMAATRFGPTACASADAACVAAGCAADTPATTPPAFHTCAFVPPPAHESVLDAFALLDGSRPFVLDAAAQLQILNGADVSVAIDSDGNITAEGLLTADEGFEVTGDLEITDGNLDIDGRVAADIVVAREIDTAELQYLTATSCPTGSTITIPAKTITCP